MIAISKIVASIMAVNGMKSDIIARSVDVAAEAEKLICFKIILIVLKITLICFLITGVLFYNILMQLDRAGRRWQNTFDRHFFVAFSCGSHGLTWPKTSAL